MRTLILLVLSGCSLVNEKIYDANDLSVGDLASADVGVDLGPADFADASADLQSPPDLTPMCVDSAACPATAPLCGSDGTCGPCSPSNDAGASTVCETFQGVRKLCLGGVCVECVSKDDCAPTNRACDISSHACAPCKAHTDCSTGVCKSGGVCATATEVAYVNNAAGCIDIFHDSTPPAAPYCQVQTAATTSGLSFVLVAGSATAYNAVNLTAVDIPFGPLTMIGPGRSASPMATIAQDGLPAVVVNASGANVTATFDGFEFIGSNGVFKSPGVSCAAPAGTATLTVVNSKIDSSGQAGVDSSGCTLALDGNMIGPSNTGGGVKLASTTYTITNNIIFRNGDGGSAANDRAGVSFDDVSSGTFSFNTIAANGGVADDFEGGLTCPSTGANKLIQSSIIALNSKNPKTSGTQYVGTKCIFQTVVGTDSSSASGLVKQDPTFTSDYHLVANDVTNGNCCVDKIAAPGTPNADHDVDATHRPKGASWDVGAHEAQ